MKEEKNKEEHEKEEESAETIEEPEAEEETVEELSHEEEKKEETTEELAEPEEEATAEIEEEEEAKPPSRKEKAKEEEEIVEERTYTVPLSKAWIMPPRKRAPRAMRILKAFVRKHMKLEKPKAGEEVGEEPAQLVISNEVNEKIWKRSIEKPPRKIRVRAAKDKEGNVTVYLAEGD